MQFDTEIVNVTDSNHTKPHTIISQSASDCLLHHLSGHIHLEDSLDHVRVQSTGHLTWVNTAGRC